jgi:hypothetical protein
MKYSYEMVSDAMIYVCTNFHVDCFMHSQVDKDSTPTEWRMHKPALRKNAKN